MPIPVACPGCAARLNAPDSAAGKRVRCPKCQAAITVPEPVPLAPEFEVVDDEPAPPKKPAAKPRAVAKADDEDDQPRKKRRDQDEDGDDEDRPKKKKRKAAAGDGGVSMTRNVVMGVVLVALLGVAGYIFYDRSKEKDGTPSNSSDANPPATAPATPTQPPPGGPMGVGVPGGPGVGAPGGPKQPGPKQPGAKQPIGTKGQPTTLTAREGFKVTFPDQYVADAMPPAMREKIGVPLATYLSPDLASGHVYLAAAVEFPAAATAAEKKEVVDRVVKEAIEDGGETPVSSRKAVKAGGRDWEELTAKEKGGGTSVTRLLQTDRRLYVLTVVNLAGTPSADSLKKFFDSFELTAPGPKQSGGKGGPDEQSVWTPDPNLVNELKQKGEIEGYQLSLPQHFTVLPSLPISPTVKMTAWAAAPGGQTTSLIAVTVFSDAKLVGEAKDNMRQALVNSSAGYVDGIGNKFPGTKITERGPTETGAVNGLPFTRFVFAGVGPNRLDMRGRVYGTIEGDQFIGIVVLGFGETAEAEAKRLESVVATFKKR